MSTQEVTFSLGTHTFPPVDPGATMRVGDIWKEEGRYSIVIVHARGRAEEFDLVGAFAAAGRNYIIVKPQDLLGEGELWPPVVILLEDAQRVQALEYEGFDKVRNAATAALQQEPAAQLLNQAFGPIANVDDDEEEMNLRRDLTHELYLGGADPTKDNENIGISALLNVHGAVHAKLFREFDPEMYGFRLFSITQIDHTRYLVLLYPAEMMAEEDAPPMVVLKVLDDKTLQTIHFSQLMAVRRDLIGWIRSNRRVRAEEFEKVFGPIAEYTSGSR